MHLRTQASSREQSRKTSHKQLQQQAQQPHGRELSNILHRSITRYLNTQANKSLFRENALIDPVIAKSKDKQELYRSPYSRARLGIIHSTTQLPQLRLETMTDSRLDQHQRNLSLVNQSILNVESNRGAIDYYAKKLAKKGGQTQSHSRQHLSPSQKRNRSKGSSDSKRQTKSGFNSKLSVASLSYHYKLMNTSNRQPDHREKFIRFLDEDVDADCQLQHQDAANLEYEPQIEIDMGRFVGITDEASPDENQIVLVPAVSKLNLRKKLEAPVNYNGENESWQTDAEPVRQANNLISKSKCTQATRLKRHSNNGKSGYLDQLKKKVQNQPKNRSLGQTQQQWDQQTIQTPIFPKVTTTPGEEGPQIKSKERAMEQIEGALDLMKQVRLPRKRRDPSYADITEIIVKCRQATCVSPLDQPLPYPVSSGGARLQNFPLTKSMKVMPTIKKLDKKKKTKLDELAYCLGKAQSQTLFAKGNSQQDSTPTILRETEAESAQRGLVSKSSLKSITNISSICRGNSQSSLFKKPSFANSKSSSVFVRINKTKKMSESLKQANQSTYQAFCEAGFNAKLVKKAKNSKFSGVYH